MLVVILSSGVLWAASIANYLSARRLRAEANRLKAATESLNTHPDTPKDNQ
jgi:hypothetical protein